MNQPPYRTGASSSQVEEYMEQLDNNKIPKLAGVGDKHRALQLMVQLPKQDLAEEFCRQLREPTQRRAFDDFRDMRDATAMAVAHVCESLPADAVSDYPLHQYNTIQYSRFFSIA